MPVCRICLNQSYKEVYDLYFGEPTVRHKLITCVPLLDNKLLDMHYRICEKCLNDLNISYELHERLIAAQREIKLLLPQTDDYENLDRYAFEASLRRDNILINETSHFENNAMSMIMDDVKVDEPLVQIDNIEPSPMSMSTPMEIPMAYGLQSPVPQSSREVPMFSVPIQLPLPGSALVLGNETSANCDRLSRFIEGRMCNICYRQYPNKTCLQSHIKSVHQSNGNSNIIKRKVLNNLLSSLTPNELSAINMEVAKKCVVTACNECKITLRCMHELQYHITAIHKGCPINNVHFNVKCNICNLVFSHKYLELHVKGHGLKVKLTDIFKKMSMPKTGPFVVVQFWQCQICKVLYKTSEQSIEEHYLKIHQQSISS